MKTSFWTINSSKAHKIRFVKQRGKYSKCFNMMPFILRCNSIYQKAHTASPSFEYFQFLGSFTLKTNTLKPIYMNIFDPPFLEELATRFSTKRIISVQIMQWHQGHILEHSLLAEEPNTNPTIICCKFSNKAKQVFITTLKE